MKKGKRRRDERRDRSRTGEERAVDEAVEDLEVEGEEGIGGEEEVGAGGPLPRREHQPLVEAHSEEPLPRFRVHQEDERSRSP